MASFKANLDMTVLEELRMVDGDGENSVFCDVLKIFLNAAETEISAINQAVNRNDLTEIGRLAHKFKSSCYTVGAVEMGVVCQYLEDHAKKADLKDGAEKMTALAQNYMVVQPELKIILADSLARGQK